MESAQQVTEVVLPGIVEPSGLEVRTAPAAVPATGQVVIAMEASGLSFADAVFDHLGIDSMRACWPLLATARTSPVRKGESLL